MKGDIGVCVCVSVCVCACARASGHLTTKWQICGYSLRKPWKTVPVAPPSNQPNLKAVKLNAKVPNALEYGYTPSPSR